MSNQRREILSQLNGLLFEAVQTGNLDLLKFFITKDKPLALEGADRCLKRLTNEYERYKEKIHIEQEKLLIAHGVATCLREIGNEQFAIFRPFKLENEKNFTEYFEKLKEAKQSALDSYRNSFQTIIDKLEVFKSEEPIYWKGLTFLTSGLKKRILGQPHHYSVTFPNQQTKVFREDFVLGESQSSVASLGIANKTILTSALLTAIASPKNREILAVEILPVLMELSRVSIKEEAEPFVPEKTSNALVTAIPSNNIIVQRFVNSTMRLLTPEWKKLYADLVQKKQLIEKLVREIKAILEADNAPSGYLELDAVQLLQWLSGNKSNRGVVVPDAALRQALQEESAQWQRIKAYCSTEEVTRCYVEEYQHRDQFWLGKRSAKLFALEKNIALFCFDYVHNEHEVPTLRYNKTSSTQSTTAVQSLYLIYRDDQRVNLLVESDGNDNEFYCSRLIEEIKREMKVHLKEEKVKSESYEQYIEESRKEQELSINKIKAQITKYKQQQNDLLDQIKHYKKIKEQRGKFRKALSKEALKKIENPLKGTMSDVSFVAHVESTAILPDEIRDLYDNTLLTIAAKNNQKNVIRFLIENGASLHSRNRVRETPLIVIAQSVGFNTENRLYFEALVSAHKEAKPHLQEIENLFETLVKFSKSITSNFAYILKFYKEMQRDRLTSFWDRFFSDLAKKFNADLTKERAVNLAKAYDILVNNEKSHNYALMLGDLARLLGDMQEKGFTEDSWLYGGIEYIKDKGDKWMVLHGQDYHKEYDVYRRMQEWEIKEMKAENRELRDMISQQDRENKNRATEQDNKIVQRDNKIAQQDRENQELKNTVTQQGKEIKELRDMIQAVLASKQEVPKPSDDSTKKFDSSLGTENSQSERVQNSSASSSPSLMPETQHFAQRRQSISSEEPAVINDNSFKNDEKEVPFQEWSSSFFMK